MNRRTFILSTAAVTLIFGTPVSAQTAQDQIVRQLQQQGYGGITVRRTLLGRVQIRARRGVQEREIIFNPSTGAILRDYWEDAPGRIQSGGDNDEGSGRHSDEDGDDQDDDDDSDDDDNSESGSSNSGSGSGSSGSGSGDDEKDDDDDDD